MKAARIVVCSIVVLCMVACSSGDGTPFIPLPVTAANATSVLGSGLDGLDNMFGGTEFSLGIFDGDLDCVTGSADVSENDTPPVGEPNVGDSLTVTFNACTDKSGEQYDGTVTIRITGVSGDLDNPPFTLGFSVTFNLTISEGGDSFTVTGGFDITLSDDGNGGIGIVMSGTNFSLVGTEDGEAINQSLTNFRYALTFDENTGDYTVDYSGTISDGELGGGFDFATTTPFSGTTSTEFDLEYPDAGVLEVTGAGGSKAILTVTGVNAVQIQIDEDGDGNFETTINTTWDAVYG
jgi:hypothetical protein